jgi:hypothetical protein
MNVLELQRRVLDRVGDDPDADPSLMHYTPSEALAALNQCQRLFCLFTLCLETTANFSLTGQASYHLLSTFADWIAPLRIRNGLGAKMRPSRLTDLAALDQSWRVRTGTPTRYNIAGFDLLSVYKSNTSVVPITYARSAVPLLSTYPADNGQAPEIPARSHPALIAAAVPILRIKEGMQEWQKTLPGWDQFLDEVEDVANQVRARNRELGYDSLPAELKRMDRSRMLQKATG